MKGRWIRIILFALILSETILLSFPVQAKVIVKDFEELKEVLECEQKKQSSPIQHPSLLSTPQSIPLSVNHLMAAYRYRA